MDLFTTRKLGMGAGFRGGIGLGALGGGTAAAPAAGGAPYGIGDFNFNRFGRPGTGSGPNYALNNNNGAGASSSSNVVGEGGAGGGGGVDDGIRRLKLVDQVVKSFRVAKLFKMNTDRINSIDFSGSGELLVTSADDDQITVFDCETGTCKANQSRQSKKYGAGLIQFTHVKDTVIHSSVKVNDAIHYLTLNDNSCIRYFTGHTKKVTSLCMSPRDDTFISTSLDNQLRLWDVRSPNCQGLMHLNACPVAGFDPEGLLFALGLSNECVKLYDLRSFDKGPFANFNKSFGEKDGAGAGGGSDWTSLKFSPDGKMIMTCNNRSVIQLIDAFHGTPLQTFVGHNDHHFNKELAGLTEASFTPDSQYLICGSADGRIHIWNIEHGYKLRVMNADHVGPSDCVKFNPKLMMLATACTNVAFWLPTIEIDD